MKRIYFLLYIIIGIWIYLGNTDAAIMYFSVLPFHYALFRHFYAKGDLVLTCFSFILLLSMGINPVFFFLNLEKIQFESRPLSSLHITAWSYLSVYSHVFVFLIVIFFLNLRYRSKNSFNIVDYSISYLKKLVSGYNVSLKYNYYLYAGIILMSIITIWMYNHNIGILGLQQRELPFHLTGFLFYLRRYVFGIIIIILYIKCSNKNYAFIACAAYATIGGLTACSKSVPLIFLVPIICESFLTGHKLRGLSGLFLSIFLFAFISLSRNLIFQYDQVEYDILAIVAFSWDALKNVEASTYIIDIMESFTGRFQGATKLVLSGLYHDLGVADLISFYSGTSLGILIPNFESQIFDIELPEDKAYGVSVGYMGTIVLLSSGSYLLSAIQGVFMFAVFRIMNRLVQKVFLIVSNPIIRFFFLGIVAYAVLNLTDGYPFSRMYIYILILFVIYSFVLNKCKRLARI